MLKLRRGRRDIEGRKRIDRKEGEKKGRQRKEVSKE